MAYNEQKPEAGDVWIVTKTSGTYVSVPASIFGSNEHRVAKHIPYGTYVLFLENAQFKNANGTAIMVNGEKCWVSPYYLHGISPIRG